MDFRSRATDHGPEGDQYATVGELDVYAKQSNGIVDPRARLAPGLMEDFDRCFQHGAWFIVFAHPAITQELIVARREEYGYSRHNREAYDGRIWRLTSVLSNVGVKRDQGTELSVIDAKNPIGALLGEHLQDATFTCTLSCQWPLSDHWTPLVRNKFGQTVAALIKYDGAGGILLLPRLSNPAEFVSELFSDVLPALAPNLFPSAEVRGWTHNLNYELQDVVQIKAAKEEVITRAREELAKLDKQIEAERAANGWMHGLLTETGDGLVKAVIKAFEDLGLKKVVDVDEELDKDGVSRREDLQVHDNSPTLVIDVKGLAGHPSDADAFQSHKHATLRLQEWQRFDVRALTIINHQRQLAPLDRDNRMPFRQEILDFADEMKMGLITTWDLYRLVRSKRQLGWAPDHAASALYQVGRIEPIPSHYAPLGVIHHVYTGVISIQVTHGELRLHDRIAYEADIEFIEEVVDSMQVDKTPQASVGPGVNVGVKSKFGRPNLKDGMRVFVDRDKPGSTTT